MRSDFLFLYRRIRGKSVSDLFRPGKTQPVEDFFAGILEEGYNVVLRALLDELETHPAKDQLAGTQVFAENRGLLVQTEEEIKKITRDFEARLKDFQKNWQSRFSYSVMYPGLKANKWIQQQAGTYCLKGCGTKAESRLFYQQTVQDMLVEGIRILALFSGTLNRFHEKTSVAWRRQLPQVNSGRVYMLIEETLRRKETVLLKDIRSGVSELFKTLFTREVRNWSDRSYSCEHILFRKMAWPWYSPGRVESGFEGYLMVFIEFLAELITLLLEASANKWRLFLRGVDRTAEVTII